MTGVARRDDTQAGKMIPGFGGIDEYSHMTGVWSAMPQKMDDAFGMPKPADSSVNDDNPEDEKNTRTGIETH